MKISPSFISFVGRSKRRQDILQKLQEKSLSQPELKKLTGMYKTHTSRTLTELSEKKLISCINPQDREFKFYKITSLGKKIIAEVQRILKG
jgi:predicted transcriptional regulator